MSRGCLVIATNVGGNTELCKKKYLCKKKEYLKIEKMLENISKEDLKNEAISNIEKSKEYSESKLETKRKLFLNKIISGEK